MLWHDNLDLQFQELRDFGVATDGVLRKGRFHPALIKSEDIVMFVGDVKREGENVWNYNILSGFGIHKANRELY